MPPMLVDSDLKSNLFNTLALKSYELLTNLTELLQFSAGQMNQIESAVREARHRVRDPSNQNARSEPHSQWCPGRPV